MFDEVVSTGRNSTDMLTKSRFAEVDVFISYCWVKGYAFNYVSAGNKVNVLLNLDGEQQEKEIVIGEDVIRLHRDWLDGKWHE